MINPERTADADLDSVFPDRGRPIDPNNPPDNPNGNLPTHPVDGPIVYYPPERIYDPPIFVERDPIELPPRRLPLEGDDQSEIQTGLGNVFTIEEWIEHREFGKLLWNPLSDRPLTIKQGFTVDVDEQFREAVFKNTRRAAKVAVKDPDSAFTRLGKRIFGEQFDTAIKEWGEEGAKPWSFAIDKERRRDEIKDPLQREFWEEFDDEFGDACRDASYVIADGLDSWAAEQRMQQEAREGNQVAIEFMPNREIPDERMIVAGSEDEIRTQLVTTMNTYEMIEHRDIGMYMGEPLRTHARKRVPPLTLRVVLFNWPSPPFYRSGIDTRKVTCNVPGIKRNKLDWNIIKEAFGGNTGYLWGRFYTVVNLKDSQGNYAGQMQIFGGSKAEAERRMDRVLELTEYEELTRTHGEEDESRTNNNNGRKYKASTRIYPGYMTIINARKVAREDLGQPSYQGTYKRSRDKILLYPDSRPSDYQERVNELLSNLPQ